MQIYQYPVSRFPFHQWIESCNFLEYVRTFLNPTDEKCMEFYSALVNDPKFQELYNKYLKYISPFFDSSGLISENIPLVRFHRNNNFSFIYNLTEHKLLAAKAIVYTPITPMAYTSSFGVESQAGLGDFNFVNMKIGDFYVDRSRGRRIKDLFQNSMGFTSVSLMSIFI